jgi:hypothetical protein
MVAALVAGSLTAERVYYLHPGIIDVAVRVAFCALGQLLSREAQQGRTMCGSTQQLACEAFSVHDTTGMDLPPWSNSGRRLLTQGAG